MSTFNKTLENGNTVSGTKMVTLNEEGGAQVNTTRVNSKGVTHTHEKTYSPEAFAALMERANTLGQKLAENPKELPGGHVADGSFLLKISA